MLKKGLAVAVILLFIGVAFAIPINANVSKSSLNPVSDIDVLEEDNATPIALVFQLIAKLRNNKELQELVEDADDEVDIQKEIISIIEKDEELNTIVEEIKELDCGCDEDSTTLDWSFPVICLLLFPLVMIFTVAHLKTGIDLPFYIIMTIGSILNCMWQL